MIKLNIVSIYMYNGHMFGNRRPLRRPPLRQPIQQQKLIRNNPPQQITDHTVKRTNQNRFLTVLLFHNDEDIIEDQIKYYKYDNYQDIIVFNHNSNDSTSKIINNFKKDILCIYDLSEKIEFKTNQVHKTIYNILLGNIDKNNPEIKLSDNDYYNYNYSKKYDWISFPESDEFLEGPDRTKSYYEHLCNISNDPKINKIKFSNIIYWFTENDDLDIKLPSKRIKYYCYKKKCGIRLYAWRANKTAVRFFGHENTVGRDKDLQKEMVTWKTRHYEIRSKEHFLKKIKDRVSVTRGNINRHYKILYDGYHNNKDFGIIKPEELHYDNGIDEINMVEKFDWRKIY